MMYGYIYKTTNKVNGKIYVGKHKSSNFDTDYVGSGKLLNYAIKKYGIQNFVCEQIDACDSLDELNAKEKYWIDFYNSKDKNIGYNILSGGDGGCEPGRVLSDEHKRKIGKSNKGKTISDEQKKILSLCHKGIPLSDEHKHKISEGNKGKTISQEQKEKLRQVNLGKTHSDVTKRKISEALKLTGKERADKRKRTIAERYPEGIKMSEESNLKRSRSLKGVKKSEEHRQHMRKPKSEEQRQNMIIAQRVRREAEKLGLTYSEYRRMSTNS